MIIARNKGEHLKLGDLNGNQFKLVIRDVKVLLKNEEKRQKFDLQKIVANAKENISLLISPQIHFQSFLG